MAEDRPPLDQLLDLVVFAPLGVMAAWREDLPKLAARGRREAELAKMIGRFAVQHGQRQLEAKLGSLRSAATPSPAAAPESPSRRRTSPPEQDRRVDAVTVSSAEVTPDVAADELPIPQYDSLAASQVVARLAALAPEELAAVAWYETAHRARRTVLGKISQLQAAT